RGTSEQQQWLIKQLATAPKNSCLIVSVHHPPYSLDSVHGGYPDIEIAIDSAIKATGRVPDAVLSGHVHSYQRFERTLGAKKVPYIVAGSGGYANIANRMHRLEKDSKGKPLPKGFQTTHKDLKLMAHDDTQPGFLRVTVDRKKKTTTFEFFEVTFGGAFSGAPSDSVAAKW